MASYPPLLRTHGEIPTVRTEVPGTDGASALGVCGEALVDLLCGEAEVGQRVPVRRPRVTGPLLGGQRAHGLGGLAGKRQAKPLVDRLDRAERVRGELVIRDVAEPCRIVPVRHGREGLEAARP